MVHQWDGAPTLAGELFLILLVVSMDVVYESPTMGEIHKKTATA
jgi:hypothetical protein